MFDLSLGQISGMTESERLVGLCGILALCLVGLWVVFRRLASGPPPAEPWDREVAEALDRDDCTPLCHHCLTPHPPAAYFCPECGAAVGACTNLLPYPYLFSIGHALRVGTSETFRRSPLTVSGFVLFALAEYGPFVPIYWIKLVRNIVRPIEPPPAEHPGPPPANPPDQP